MVAGIANFLPDLLLREQTVLLHKIRIPMAYFIPGVSAVSQGEGNLTEDSMRIKNSD
jgi:hypothetical protein